MARASGLILNLILLSTMPVSAQTSFYDPTYCFVLDGFLLIYGIVITGFFVRERYIKQRPVEESHYQAIDKLGKSEYATANRTQRGSEEGRSGGRRRADETYTPLTRKGDDTYRELETKGDRRRQDQLYQGLSSVTKDTYDSLQMQQLHPLPPR
ncbi:T-cell surface glycoprotein CD3 zeta chain precursor [Danio rerio]|uniref:T-cell surface glycoprotein CD3 zeta chain n=1 Tax=Danio rerio TaxID=7955 RepID=A7KX13_DANRE|nr:T-cell surface glycoprotein CD3 zeta chain precursor [Danio rerio]ABS18393.1 CD247 antigen [Danio rerio]|eukprot:NP_001093627.1 T-cell surface glycoprotein CD3 zeta chain precursor [Danio rerio]